MSKRVAVGLGVLLFVFSLTSGTQTDDHKHSPRSRATTGSEVERPSPSPTPPAAQSIAVAAQPDYDHLLSDSRAAVEYATTLVHWTGVAIAVFGFLFAIAGFFGVNELRTIHARQKDIENLHSEFDTHVSNVRELEKKLDEELRNLAKRFQMESQVFMEAAHNFTVAEDAYKAGDNKKAIRFFGRALQLQSKNLRILCRLGRCHTNLDEIPQAIAAFQGALAVDPNNAEALRGLATTYRYSDTEKALEYAECAVKAEPTDYEGWDYLGLLYRDKKRTEDAISAHHHARQIKERPETYFFLSLLYEFKKDHERSRVMMDMAAVNLDDPAVREEIRPLWRYLIQTCQLILRKEFSKTWPLTGDLRKYASTERAAAAVVSHLQFLLDAIGHPELLEKYKSIIHGTYKQAMERR